MKKVVRIMLLWACLLLLPVPGARAAESLAFENFEELKMLAGKTYEHLTWAEYTGSGALTIQENLTLPENLCIDAGSGLTIPGDVVLDASSAQHNTALQAGTVTVAGTLSCDLLTVTETLSITGTLENNNAVYLEEAAVSGADRMTFGCSWSRVYSSAAVENMDDLKKGIQAAESEPDTRWQHTLHLEGALLMDQSLTVPENCRLVIDAPDGETVVTLAKGCILDLKGTAWINDRLVMEGVLVNRGGITVDKGLGGMLVQEKTGYYLGNGEIEVFSDGTSGLSGVLQGMKLSDFETKAMPGGVPGWLLTNTLTHEISDFEAKQQAASCEAEGCTVYTCPDCGASFETDHRPALGHAYTAEIISPTCGQKGCTRHTCANCGDVYETDILQPTGQHSYQDGVCTVCGQEKDSPKTETTPMYRLYNPNSGEHFYTGSTEERDILVAAGWQYEGVSWNAPIKGGTPVYRVYNPNSGDHHYTMDQAEVDMLVSVGWQYEGVCWNGASAENIPLYRLWNPNADCGSHHYTSSTEERDQLVALGWILEGTGWYGMLK